MVDPVSGGIPGEGKVAYGISFGFVIKFEQGICKDDVCGFGENVIV
jgi:hypothetical protein